MKAAAVVVGILVGVVLLLVFATGLLQKRGKPKQLCDNSLCITMPAGLHGETYYGGTESQLVVSSFVHTEGQGTPPIGHGRFEILIFNRWLYQLGYPPVNSIIVSRCDIRSTKFPPARSAAHRRVGFRGHSLDVLVSFGDSRPAREELDLVNRILATVRRAPPPKLTK